jgi:hypothetical protein
MTLHLVFSFLVRSLFISILILLLALAAASLETFAQTEAPDAEEQALLRLIND